GFSSSIPGKKEGAAFATAVTKAVSGNTYIESTQVLLGKDDWLFYKSVEDGDPVSDYIGEERFSEQQKADAAANLSQLTEYFKGRSQVFAAMSIPNKASVYPEQMPDTIIQVNDYSKGRELVDYVQSNTGVNMINAYPALMEARKDRQVYYSTDTHFNQIGNFVACMELLKGLGLPTQPLSSVSFKEIYKDWSGDLALICSMSDQFKQDTYYELNTDTVDPNAKNHKKLLLIGDSFASQMTPILKNYFDEVNYVNIVEFTPEMLDQYEADYVVWEACERYTKRFFEESLLY
ncbi:MAG: hypothetical protein HUJ54_14090, partial [Erysipelotrichaceae bacterium]|nr:hypothetical protein [Erysipelotrichaceae bacterium]